MPKIRHSRWPNRRGPDTGKDFFGRADRGGRFHRRGTGIGSRLLPIILVTLAVVAVLVAADYRMNVGEIHRGVEAGSVPLGGKSPEEARAVLEERSPGALEEIRLEGPRETSMLIGGIGAGLDPASTVEKAYAVGREGNVFERLRARLQATFGTVIVEPEVGYDSGLVQAEVERLASQLNEEPRDASVRIAGDEVEVGEASSGYEVNVAATAENVGRAVRNLDGEAGIAGERLAPVVETREAERAASQVRRAIQEPLVLTAGEESWSLSPARVGGILDITRQGGEIRVGLDKTSLWERLPGMYDALTLEPVEAGYAFEAGEVAVRESSTGRRIAEDELFGAIEKGIFDGRHQYEVPVTEARPELTTAEARRLKPTRMIGRYRTTYVGTGDESGARTENLRIAANAIDGTAVAPGETFSANEILAPLDYNDAKVIVDGKVESALGGGLCQIASTVYMAVNYAGLDVTERHPHHSELSYIRPGLDSTLWFGAENGYTGQELDMKFENTSEGYVLVREYVADDGYLYAEVWGKPTGVRVEMSSRQVSANERRTAWITYQTVEREDETVFDGVLHRDTYEPLISEEGEPIPNAEPAPVRQ